MSEIYEIVFQQVERHDLYRLLKYLESCCELLACPQSSESQFGLGAGMSNDSIQAFLEYSKDACLTAKLHNFKLAEDAILELVFLRVLKYQDMLDVELSFEKAEFDIDKLMLSALRYAEALAHEFQIRDFFGGLEPANDFDTRYFTGGSAAPH